MNPLDRENTKNYYEILEIPEDADADTIHRGYLRAKNAYTQDSLALYSLMSQEECDQILEFIEEAYSILSSLPKREQYDMARGLNNRSHYGISSRGGSQESLSIHENTEGHSPSKTSQSVFKLMANMRYTLEFETDPKFEKEIEQTSDFSGEFLRQIREYKKVDIPRMAEMTKISKTYIRYIEDESFEKLPAPVYVRGFVYQYAKILKLNPELVANSFLFRMKEKKKNLDNERI